MYDAQGGISKLQESALLAAAAQRLGKSPAALRSELQSGGLEALAGSLDAPQRERAVQLLNDPQALRRTLSDPRVQALLEDHDLRGVQEIRVLERVQEVVRLGRRRGRRTVGMGQRRGRAVGRSRRTVRPGAPCEP